MAAELSGLEILETIKEGPVCHELRARQIPLERPVRVLQLAPGVLTKSPLASSLRRQAQTLAQLDHPAIVRLFDFRDEKDTLLAIVEDVIDENLAQVCQRPLSIPACLSLGLSLSHALSHAHQRGIIHGRLSPEVVRFDAEGHVKLEGFGSHLSSGEVEPIETENQGGLAPETTIGQNPSPMSDLFALGSVLYETLTGQPPFGDPRDPGHAARVRNEHPTPLVKLRPETPLAVRQLIERCLSKLAAERPSDAAQITASLHAVAIPGSDHALHQELADRGLIVFPGTGPATSGEPTRKRRYRPGRLEAVIGGCLIGALLSYGAIHWQKRRSQTPAPDLSLSTIQHPEAMLLRVVATPWAHVIVDGQHRETTPFAEPLRLSPGRHIVRLKHPSAPAEERVVEGKPGQAILLDVRMAVQKPIQPVAEKTQIPEDDSP